MNNTISHQGSSLDSSSSTTIGHYYSSSARFSSEMNVSSGLPQGRQSQISPFISQSLMDRGTLAPTCSSQSGMQSTASIGSTEEKKDLSWSIDPFQDFLEFPESAPVENGPMERNTGLTASEDHSKKTDWQDWADQLISEDVDLEPNWSEILDNVNASDSEQKVCSLT